MLNKYSNIVFEVYLSYIDTSGGPEYSDPENFVVASVIIHDTSWQNITKEIGQIKSKYFPDLHSDNVEFHVKDMLNHRGIYKEISLNATYSILDDIFDAISAKDTHLHVVGTILDKRRRGLDLEVFGYVPVFERFNRYLSQINRHLQKDSESIEYGMAIIDSAGSRDQQLRSKLSPILSSGTSYSNFNYLINSILFADSRWDDLIQIADCVAYCIRKHHRTNNTDDIHLQHWEKYYSMITDKFYSRDGEHDGYGLKIFTGGGE